MVPTGSNWFQKVCPLFAGCQLVTTSFYWLLLVSTRSYWFKICPTGPVGPFWFQLVNTDFYCFKLAHAGSNMSLLVLASSTGSIGIRSVSKCSCWFPLVLAAAKRFLLPIVSYCSNIFPNGLYMATGCSCLLVPAGSNMFPTTSFN